jgi:uncharacterized membrane protein YcaP (DUF421 family)
MLEMTANPLEIVVRVATVYLGLLVLLRLTGKKELGDLAPMDLLAMLVLSETVSPALTAQDHSVAAGGVAAATLLLCTHLMDRATFAWSGLRRLVHGVPKVLVHDGEVDRRVQRRERVSASELETALRIEGVEDVKDVHLAVIEPTGRITVIPRKK